MVCHFPFKNFLLRVLLAHFSPDVMSDVTGRCLFERTYPCSENTLWFNSQQKVPSAASFLLRVSVAGKRKKSKKEVA